MRERGREGEGVGERPRERDEDERAQTRITHDQRARTLKVRVLFKTKQETAA